MVAPDSGTLNVSTAWSGLPAVKCYGYKAEESHWLVRMVSELVDFVGWHKQGISSIDCSRLSTALCFAASLDDIDLVLVVMLMLWSMSAGLDDEMPQREVGGLVIPTDHDLHGDMLGTFHLHGRGRFRIGMSNKHWWSPRMESRRSSLISNVEVPVHGKVPEQESSGDFRSAFERRSGHASDRHTRDFIHRRI